MTPRRRHRPTLSRRDLLRYLAASPLLLRPSPLFGLPRPFPSGSQPGSSSGSQPASADAPPFDLRYTPRYPVGSPLEDVLRLVPPGSDEYVTEQYAEEIAAILDLWSDSLVSGNIDRIRQSLDASVQACSLLPASETELRSGNGVRSVRREFSPATTPGRDFLLNQLRAWIGPGTKVASADFEITAIEGIASAPLTMRTRVRVSLVAAAGEGAREQRTGYWSLDWTRSAPPDHPPGHPEAWTARRFAAEPEIRATLDGPGFVDVTQQALGRNPSFAAQIAFGADHWRTLLDGASGIDVYGNNGVAAGDFDGDGFDDLYVCQPAGLPNRLYRNRGDGTFDDVTERAGVGVLDNTACALFADLRDIGRQDLVVVCGTGPLLFLNGGDGTFTLKRDAFQFARPPQGTFTHAAVADYDGDGRLDLYFCLYSYYLGLDQYHYPAPYFDARNGPPNFLLHNRGDGSFVDRTEAAGLHAENDRYSFSCAWGHSVASRLPDLYVVNDFGRNNLYRNRGDGTFHAVSAEAHVQDVGAGMSACWADTGNRGRPDLYVANMWSAAGQRVSQQALFHPKTPEAIRDLYRRHARGNALYRNRGDGTFANASEQAAVEVGRWAWGSDFWDFDHDGYPDLYVTNGYITAGASTAPERRARPTDLGSFFWRQVVGKSPDDATPSLAYEHGWNALNELIRSDSSWSGSERNVLFANNRDGTFSDISGAVGMDFLEDGRSFALADLDGDGRLEVILKNRNSPQLRILHNAMSGLGDSVCFRLRGTTGNRDAIGATVVLTVGKLVQTKSLEAGSGFLAQHSKELFFGLGKTTDPLHVAVHWPGGLVQSFDAPPRNHRVTLVEGVATFAATPFLATGSAYAAPPAPAAPPARGPSRTETWLLDPLKAPAFSLPDLTGAPQSVPSSGGRFTLLHLWAIASPLFREQLRLLDQHHPAFLRGELSVLALNVDPPGQAGQARALAQAEHLAYPVLFATDEVAGIYNIVVRYLFDRRRDLALPTSFLLDRAGAIVKLYQGPVDPDTVLADLRAIPATPADRLRRALPFPGTLVAGQFLRNDFTYGVAMFQHGYFDQAAAAFGQVVAARPDDAEAHYNLGTLNLRRNDFAAARRYLRRTLELKPNYPEAWNNLGMMAAQEGHAEEAIESFRQSLALRPNYATALLNLGNLYRRQGNFALAGESLSHALALEPDDPEANYSLGLLFAQRNQLESAATYFRRAIALRPSYPEARNNLGVLYVREGDYGQAEQQFRACIGLVPNYEGSYLNLARLYLLRRNRPSARQALEDLLHLQPENAAARQALAALDASP